MKHKLFYLSLFATLSIQTTLHAECIDLSFDYTAADIQAIITDYTDYKVNATTITADSYEICFINEFETDASFTITSAGNDKLILKNLKIKDVVAPFISGNTLLTISNANTTINGCSFTGNGTGTAIQVNGANTVIQSSTIDKFATGIQVTGDEAQIKGPNMYIKQVNVGIDMGDAKNTLLEDLTFEVNPKGIEIKAKYTFDSNWVGKKCDVRKKVTKGDKEYEICDNTMDGNKILKIAGKPPLEAKDCTGNVSVAKFNLSNPEEKIMECQLKPVAKEDAPIWFAKYVNNTIELQEIKEGECAFVCEIGADKTLNIKDEVSLSFLNEIALFTAIKPEDPPRRYKSLSDNADVPSITGTFSMPDAGSEADGKKIIVTDNTGNTDTLGEAPGGTGPNIDGGGGTGGPKAGDGGLVNQVAGSNGGCSVVGVMGANGPISPINWATTISLLGLVPIAGRRFSRKQPKL